MGEALAPPAVGRERAQAPSLEHTIRFPPLASLQKILNSYALAGLVSRQRYGVFFIHI